MSEDVADYMETLGIGVVGSDIFVGYMPEEDGVIMAVYQYGGYAPLQPISVERPQCHILVRGDGDDGYKNAMTKANEIMALLHMAWEVTINSNRYLYFRALTSPNVMRYDYSKKPPHVYVNIDFIVYKEVEMPT